MNSRFKSYTKSIQLRSIGDSDSRQINYEQQRIVYKARLKSMREKDRESKVRIVAFSLWVHQQWSAMFMFELLNGIQLAWFDLVLAHEWIR